MSFSLERAALSVYLKEIEPVYFGTIHRLRDEITDWLAYIPATFPHYTKHTVTHSDQIVIQLSHLLFDGADPARPRLKLSPTEAYILLASAYLHDAGMVASDSEKISILASSEWKAWTNGEGGAAKRWQEIEEMRTGLPAVKSSTRDYLVNLQVRFLIAEFIRRRHHYRAADVISQYAEQLGAPTFNDPVLRQTIADVCIAHGLRQHELEDSFRYPDRRDIRGDQVNVRLLAILLRLGDLLDMSSDRACPLLLNAACPLPSDSLAHWTQYQRITHKMVAPDKIEIRAECHTQDEHTYLEDWCRWLVEETHNAAAFVGRSHRHADWTPPLASIESDPKTIDIRPARDAKYIPSRWTFQLDRDLVLERFIINVHGRQEEYIRELLQNAFDATRCKMYDDLSAEGLPPPESPTKVDEDRRERYPVYVSLRSETFENELSGEPEDKQVLTIEDRGIGMDREVITRYFLQVGWSYYTTADFRKAYSFIPTSRFGVGFLSVFSSSDDVRVETFNPKSRDGALKLRLRGAKPFLLTERAERKNSGTKIDVVLRDPYKPGDVTKWVRDWCKRVEFPIRVSEFGAEFTIRAETFRRFTAEVPDISQPNAKFAVRAYPLEQPGLEGELYLFVHTVNGEESWDDLGWATREYPMQHAAAPAVPQLPAGLLCLNGIATRTSLHILGPVIPRVDLRSARTFNLSREHQEDPVITDPAILSQVRGLLAAHLKATAFATGPNGWRYRQNLAARFEFLKDFWDEVPRTILLRMGRRRKISSLSALVNEVSVRTISSLREYYPKPLRVSEPSSWSIVISEQALRGYLLERLLSHRRPGVVKRAEPGFVEVVWTAGVRDTLNDETLLCTFEEPFSVLGVHLEFLGTQPSVLVNIQHPVIIWLKKVQEARILVERQVRVTTNLITRAVKYPILDAHKLQEYLRSMRAISNLPPELYPPELTPNAFVGPTRLESATHGDSDNERKGAQKTGSPGAAKTRRKGSSKPRARSRPARD